MKDVVIVGASVAGAATAIRLAERGLSVQLLDRAVFPRRKACGEGIFPAGVVELEHIGVEIDGLNGAHIESLAFEYGGRTAKARLKFADVPALGVQRSVLDHALLVTAEARGVEVCTPVRVVGIAAGARADSVAVETTQGTIEGRFLIAADGLNSTLRARAGLDSVLRGQRRYGMSAHWLARGYRQDRIEVHFRPGYEIYLTPLGGDLVNGAMLISQEYSRHLGSGVSEAFAARVEILLPGAQLVDEPMTAGPFPAKARRAYGDRLILVGDAAGFFDGISGEGISLALRTSAYAAEAIEGFLLDGATHHLQRYDKKLGELRRMSTLLAKLILFAAGRPWLARQAMWRLSRRADVFSKLVAINDGSAPLRSLGLRDAAGLLIGR